MKNDPRCCERNLFMQLKVGEVRRKSFSNKSFFTFVTQGLPSSFLSRMLRKLTLSELNYATGR